MTHRRTPTHLLRTILLPLSLGAAIAVFFPRSFDIQTASLPAIAQEPNFRVLTVTGQGTETLPTTIASVSLAVETSGSTAEDAQQQMAQATESVIAFLQAEPVQELETTGIRLNPRYDYRADTPRLTGYMATNRVQFETSVDQAGDLLDGSVKAGATRIDSIRFRATDEAIATAQQQALQAATLDAQQQADAVLSSLGLSRRDIVGIQINHASAPPVPMPQLARLQSASDVAEASTPVIGGDQDVRAQVTLQIQY